MADGSESMFRSIVTILIMFLCVAVVRYSSTSDIDPDRRHAWCENVGRTNWDHDTPNPRDGVLAGDTFLAGFAWSENVGWINLGSWRLHSPSSP